MCERHDLRTRKYQGDDLKAVPVARRGTKRKERRAAQAARTAPGSRAQATRKKSNRRRRDKHHGPL